MYNKGIYTYSQVKRVGSNRVKRLLWPGFFLFLLNDRKANFSFSLFLLFSKQTINLLRISVNPREKQVFSYTFRHF